MLFPYNYVPHSMETMQEYIDFIFHEVWCTAQGKDYDVEALFADNADLKGMIIELDTSEVQGAVFFLTELQQIFEDFKLFSVAELDQLRLWYGSNNNIEILCSGDPAVVPATYQDISALSGDLSKHLKAFFKNLYSQSFLDLESVRRRIGVIDHHYQEFMVENRQGKCPFCGIHDVKGIYHTKREAYDHYLPKDKFPFNTINFRNLAPTCHECNRTYKLSKNPLAAADGSRRKIFYPFSTNHYSIEVGIRLDAEDWTNITPEDVQLEIGPNELSEEIGAWLDVYGLEERYKAKCCGENDGSGWIREVIDESGNYGLSPAELLQGKLATAQNQPWVDVNFLKRPFLEACKEKGLFDIVGDELRLD